LKVPLDPRRLSPESESAQPGKNAGKSSRKYAKNEERREEVLSAFAGNSWIVFVRY
jgi:hypothetical protein